MTHKITIGIQDKRLGPGEQTIPLVGTGNPSKKMQKYLPPHDRNNWPPPKAVIDRAIKNELNRRKRGPR